MNQDLTEQTIASSTIYEGRILRLYNDTVLLPNGHEGKREYVAHPGGAAILPIDDQGNVYLVRQYRYPYHCEILEIPAGKLEPKENPMQAAIRELQEETGCVSNHIEKLGTMYPTPGYCNEILWVYFATDLQRASMHLDEDEFINLVTMPFATLLAMVMENRVHDAKTCYAVLQYALRHQKQ